jgi:hypothetical protein
MAQASKFSGALSRLREVPAAPEEPVESSPPPPLPAAAPVTPPTPAKGRGRPAGKRSDPDFKPTTLLLREKTKRAAMRLLEDNGRGQDLSELVEQLLAQWNKRQG